MRKINTNQLFIKNTKNHLYSIVITIILIIMYSQKLLYTNSACIIIHGTWAQNEDWYQPNGDFFNAVTICNNEIKEVDQVVSFQWSGKLGDIAQIEAAKMLAKKISLYDHVILIAHSHGTTVGIIASNLLAEIDTGSNNFDKISKFYALGAPICEMDIYSPNMNVISKLYNLFSFGDFIQTINGSYNRTFLSHPRIVNISILLNEVHPNHTEMHHPAIGLSLLKIEYFENFSFSYPGLIRFFLHKNSFYEQQPHQYKLLKDDKTMHQLMNLAFFRSKKQK
ncbi:hypothetical protein HYV11_04075 [Candidatus Dependentiae bacterium]|nr:hypothetical protein [Candidatus Dependentiae bacterium]